MSAEFFRRYIDILNEFAPAGSGGDVPPRGPRNTGRDPWGDDGDDDGYSLPGPAIVADPAPEKSETLAYAIKDMDEDEFGLAWSKLPREYQEEFGWDLPLWSHDDLRNTPGIKILKNIPFERYVKHVKRYMERDQMTKDVLGKMRTGPAKQ